MLKCKPALSARGIHPCGNPPASSPAVCASDVQAENSIATNTTRVGNQGLGRSKLLVKNKHLVDLGGLYSKFYREPVIG